MGREQGLHFELFVAKTGKRMNFTQNSTNCFRFGPFKKETCRTVGYCCHIRAVLRCRLSRRSQKGGVRIFRRYDMVDAIRHDERPGTSCRTLVHKRYVKVRYLPGRARPVGFYTFQNRTVISIKVGINVPSVEKAERFQEDESPQVAKSTRGNLKRIANGCPIGGERCKKW